MLGVSDLWIEIIGYVASAFVVVSITQTSILRLRLLGLVGSLIFIAYSIAIGAYPIAIVNVIITGLHLWYLRKLIRKQAETFRVLHVLPESRYLADLLDFHADDIARFAPGFAHDLDPDRIHALILRDMVPAGIFVGSPGADGAVEVHLDFVIPQYRDFRLAGFVYSADSGLFAEDHPTVVWTDAASPRHADYLAKVGFSPSASDPLRYELEVPRAAPASAGGSDAAPDL